MLILGSFVTFYGTLQAPLQKNQKPLHTRQLCLTPKGLSTHHMEKWLRSYTPPIIARVERDLVLLDIRTIQEKELKTVAQAIKELAAQ